MAHIDAVRTVMASRETSLIGEQEDGQASLIATGLGSSFRLVRGLVTRVEGGVRVDSTSARMLGVSKGDTLRVAELETLAS